MSGRAEGGLGLSLLLAGKAFSLLTHLLVVASSCSPVLAPSGRESKDLSPGSFGAGLGEEEVLACRELHKCSAVLR